MPSLLEAHALALGKGPETLGKGFTEGCPRQRTLREFLDGEGVFAEGPLSGTRQSLCRGSGRPSAKKRSRQAPAPLAVSLPRADPRQRNGFFLNLFAEGRPSANKFFYFFKNLCRGPPPWPSAKKFSGFFPKNLCRGLLQGPSAKVFFKKKFFAEGRPSAKKWFFLNFFF